MGSKIDISNQRHFVQGKSSPTSQDHTYYRSDKSCSYSILYPEKNDCGNINIKRKCLRLFCHNSIDNDYLTRWHDQQQID